MIQVKKEVKSRCWHCASETGFGKGKEPKRHDIHWCSSECHQKFFRNRRRKDINYVEHHSRNK